MEEKGGSWGWCGYTHMAICVDERIFERATASIASVIG
jgi:hypothetical protein